MDSKNSNFQKLYAVCKEFREKIDKCVNEHRNLFINFPHGYCDHICIWAYDYLTSKGYTNIEFRIHDPFPVFSANLQIISDKIKSASWK